VDYFLILLGASLSVFLLQIGGPLPMPKADTPEWVSTHLLPLLPVMMYLPQGILLLWPLFYLGQRLRGRPQALSAGEWLWGVAWIGTLLLTAWVSWMRWGTPPEFAEDLQFPPQAIWTIIVSPVMAAIALAIGVINLFARWKQTWTHTFGLVLLLWPVLPLSGLLLWAEPGWKWLPLP
jgi:hypothetical protein